MPVNRVPTCTGLTHLFFGPDLDGRTEIGRHLRERYCKSLCFRCPFRVSCLQAALEIEEPWGVWGGMGEGERRKFKRFLQKRGITDTSEATKRQMHQYLNAFYTARAAEKNA